MNMYKMCIQVMILLERRHMKYQEGDGRITLRWISGKYVLRMGGGWNWVGILCIGGLWY